MKAAADRAAEFLAVFDLHAEAAVLGALTLSFKEHARDQRHLCAEAVTSAEPFTARLGPDYHAVVMNTRAPGEAKR
jgi:hypothetical protein